MGFGVRPGVGITKLSELEIDTSKDWLSYLIKNIGDAVDPQDALALHQAILQSLLTTHGDIIYRGVSGAERLAPDRGTGLNFLRSRGAGFPPEWTDIEAIIDYKTGTLIRIISLDLRISAPDISQVTQQASSPPGRTAEKAVSIPKPSVSLETAEDHSGGAHTAEETLTIPTPSISVEVVLV